MLFPEPRYQEKGCGQQKDHHRRRGLVLLGGEPTVDDDGVEPLQLAGQRLVLRLQGLDSLLQLCVLDHGGFDALLHVVNIFLLPFPRVLR